MSNRLENFIHELETYGKDISVENGIGTSLIIRSEKTSFYDIENDLNETASHYGMTMGLLSENTCEFY